MSETLLIEIIKALSLVLAAGVPSVVALLINRSRLKKEALKRDLIKALNDIKFLLAVEAEHVRVTKEQSGDSNRNIVRKTVHARDLLNWSGSFASNRIERKLESLK